MSWEQAATAKREALLSLIPQEWRIPAPPPASEQRDITGPYIEQYLSPSEVEITNTDAVSITDHARSGRWTAVDITRAFCHRAAVAHQLANCLHEIFFDDALAAAKALDEHRAQHGRVKGLLHGLPVSLKDQVHVRGVETSMGYVGWLGTFQGERGTGKERVFESEIARELRGLGAVLYCKTAVPHTLMCGETVNNIVGYVNNPKNRNLSAGGSSGGEGALIALGASPVGLGTDIGGSIRIPAAFNGLYGLRPSAGRFPYEGMANSFDGGPGIISVVGPLAPTTGALRLVTRALLSQEPWLHDPMVHELPYRDQVEHETLSLANSGKLSFAVLRHDGVCAPHPPVARAVERTVEALTKAGHKVIEWKPPVSHQLLGELAMKCFAFDGGRDAAKAFGLSDEPMAPHVMGPYKEPIDEATATEIMQTMVAKREMCKDYMDHWNSTAALTGTGRPVDAIITPLAPFSAARPTKYTYYGYSTFVNLLDYTAVVLPVLDADKAIDERDQGFQAVSDLDRATQDSYDAEVYDGAPVGVQLVGRRLQEEKMLALAEYVGQLV